MGNEKAVFEGRTLEDAVRKGLEEIGRTRAEVMITILEEGSGGFLGLGARPYKVRIMPRPGGAFREPEREREREGSRGGRGGRGRSEGGRGEAGRGREREGRERGGARPGRGERPERVRREGAEGARRPREAAARPGGERPVRDAGPPRRDERGREDRPMREALPPREPEMDAGREPTRARDDAAGAGGGRRRRRGRRGGGAGAERGGRDEVRREAPIQEAPPHELSREPAPREREPVEAPSPRGHDADREPERFAGAATAMSTPGMSPDELAATAKRITEEFFAKLGFEATVTSSAQEDHVDVAASVGAHEALLTGPKGEVRQSLQHLLNRMLNRGEGSRYHLQLEINEFWKHREDELRALAQRLAEEALASDAEAFTEYLNAQERRIVHVALKEDARVKTYALGTGLIKRVAVAPADFPEGPRSD